MKTKTIFSFLLVVSVVTSIRAQFLSSMNFETEFNVKISVGQEKRETMEYEPGFTINYPKTAVFQNPVYSLEVSSLFPLSNNFQSGITAGIAIAMNEKNPLSGNQYFHRVLIPVVGRIQYLFTLGSNFELSPETRIGYQFVNENFGNTDDGFIYIQSGGITTGMKIRVSKKTEKYSPSLCIGYELCRIRNEVSLGWIDGYEYDDKYLFTTNYHLISLGIGIRM